MKRDCQHKQASHRHGTSTAYVLDKCRCAECREANRADAARRRKQQAFGRYESPYVDAQPVRDHVQRLNDAGIGLKTIARRAHISHSTLSNLIYGRPGRTTGPSKNVRRHTAERVLAVTADQHADGARIDATGTLRRLQALVAIGWSISELGRRLNINPTNMTTTLARNQVRQATAQRVRDLYDQLWETPPKHDDHRSRVTYSRARNYAKARGWLPPLAFDDDTIDDPEWQPDTDEITRRYSKQKIHVEDIEDVLDWDPRADWTVIETRLHVKHDSVYMVLRRAGRLDLADRLTFNRQEYAA